MGSYVESNLIKNEKVQYEGKISVWSLLPRIILGLILIPLFGFGLLLWASAVITYFTTELVITNKRVVAKFGLIRRHTIEMNIAKVESIQVDQGFLGRIFNFGSILISGSGDPKTPIPGITQPLLFRKVFFEVQEDEKYQQENVVVEVA